MVKEAKSRQREITVAFRGPKIITIPENEYIYTSTKTTVHMNSYVLWGFIPGFLVPLVFELVLVAELGRKPM